MRRRLGSSACAILLMGGGSLTASASETIATETTAPESAVELPTTIELAFEDSEPPPGRLPALERMVAGFPAFLRDAKLQIKPRSYVFDREDPNGNQREAWAIGGELAVETGQLGDLVSFGLSFYTSQRLHGPDGKGFTGVLTSDQEAINTLGQLWVQLGRQDQFAVVAGRMTLPLPYINQQDTRMIPITHEAFVLGRYGTGRDFVIGHVTEQKNQDSDEFVPMSKRAGARDADKGVSLLGGAWESDNGFEIGAITEYGWDTFNTFYTETSWAPQKSEKWSLRIGAQYTDQRSVGDELAGDYDTSAWGVKGSLGYKGAIATLALTEFADDAYLLSPFGGIPAYNSVIVSDFDRPGERAVRVGLSYNMARLGLPGWSGFSNLVYGTNAEDPDTGLELEDRKEYDLTLDFKPKSGYFEGLWVRLRYAYVDFDRRGNLNDLRLIVNYDLPAL